MDEKTQQILLSEYQANLELWKHDDNLRQQRFTIFLSINSLLLVALGGLVTLSTSILVAAFIAILISLFGFPICLMWQSIQARNAEYIRFRRYQLRFIESKLKPMSTFTNQWNALAKHETVRFENIKDEFVIKKQAKGSSTAIEGKLPIFLAIFWGIVFFGSVSISILRIFD